MSQEP